MKNYSSSSITRGEFEREKVNKPRAKTKKQKKIKKLAKMCVAIGSTRRQDSQTKREGEVVRERDSKINS